MATDDDRLELVTDDPDDLFALYDELRVAPGIRVDAVPGTPAPGEQGAAVDLLSVALSGGGLAAMVKLLTVYAKTRGPVFRLKIRRGGDTFELTAENAEEARKVIGELLRGS